MPLMTRCTATTPSQQTTTTAEVKAGNRDMTTDIQPPTAIGAYDAEKQVDLEKADNSRKSSSSPSRCASEHEVDGRTVVSFDENDPLNPYRWKRAKKLFVV